MIRNCFFLLLAIQSCWGQVFAEDVRNLPAPYCDIKTLYNFDPFGWFNEQKQLVLKRLMQENGVKVVVEIGSFLGKSTRFIAKQLPGDGRVYAVDHWKGNLEHQNPQRTDVYPKIENLYNQFLSNIIHANLCNKVIPIKTSSLEAVKIIEDEPNLVFIDASHEYEDVLCDLIAWYPRVSQNGVLCGDDWEWGGDRYPVQKAVIDFASQRGLKYFVEGAIWWIYKKADERI